MGSVVIRLRKGDPSPATLALVAGLAVYEAVLPYLANPSGLALKWPNDLMLNGAKLAGILLERSDDAIVAGFGVNLAQASELPDRRTVALADCGPCHDRDTFAHTLAATFLAELQRWRSFGQDGTIARWLAAGHAEGTPLTVHQTAHETLSGTFAGLEADGGLRLRLADGSMRVIHAGDVFV